MTDETLRKALFRSPVSTNDKPSADPESAMRNYQIELDMDRCRDHVVKEQHEQRLKQLKQSLKTFNEDNWRYPAVEKLIGLQD